MYTNLHTPKKKHHANWLDEMTQQITFSAYEWVGCFHWATDQFKLFLRGPILILLFLALRFLFSIPILIRQICSLFIISENKYGRKENPNERQKGWHICIHVRRFFQSIFCCCCISVCVSASIFFMSQRCVHFQRYEKSRTFLMPDLNDDNIQHQRDDAQSTVIALLIFFWVSSCAVSSVVTSFTLPSHCVCCYLWEFSGILLIYNLLHMWSLCRRAQREKTTKLSIFPICFGWIMCVCVFLEYSVSIAHRSLLSLSLLSLVFLLLFGCSAKILLPSAQQFAQPAA